MIRLLTALICALAVTLMAGCSVIPHSIRGEYEHVSHPFAGPPFGPTSEEDWLDHAQIIGRWKRGRAYADLGLGYVLTDGGFYGPKLTGTVRVGVELWSRDEGGLR